MKRLRSRAHDIFFKRTVAKIVYKGVGRIHRELFEANPLPRSPSLGRVQWFHGGTQWSIGSEIFEAQCCTLCKKAVAPGPEPHLSLCMLYRCFFCISIKHALIKIILGRRRSPNATFVAKIGVAVTDVSRASFPFAVLVSVARRSVKFSARAQKWSFFPSIKNATMLFVFGANHFMLRWKLRTI